MLRTWEEIVHIECSCENYQKAICINIPIFFVLLSTHKK